MSCKLTITFFLTITLLPVMVSGKDRFKCTYNELQHSLQIVDVKNNYLLLNYKKEDKIWRSDSDVNLGGRSTHGTRIVPQINVQVYADGFDLEFSFHNNTVDTSSMGELYIGPFYLDSIVHFRNTTYTFQEVEFHARKNFQFMSGAKIYPSSTSYAPVTVLRDQEYIVGISIIYPFTEYRHSVNQLVQGNNFEGGEINWALVIQMNKNANGERYNVDGEIAPGETRKYKICIRVAEVKDIKEDWKKVIEPYKTYFQTQYPKMEYKSDRRPVLAYHGVSDHLVNEDNPYGYWNARNDPEMTSHPMRPDEYGFKPVVEYLNQFLKQYSFKRLMYWAPTGLYKQHPQLNYPFQFMSQWQAFGNARSLTGTYMMEDGIENFRDLAGEKYEVGFWWGHAAYVSQYWDSPEYELFDPLNQEHWQLSLKEIEVAKEVQASCIGLDSFNDLPGWDQVTWLDSMISFTNHSIKFVSETYSFDVIHTKAAFYYADWNVMGPHLLADYLVPHNEKWMHFNMEVQTKEMARKWAKEGYVLCVFGYLGGPEYPRYKAKKSCG